MMYKYETISEKVQNEISQIENSLNTVKFNKVNNAFNKYLLIKDKYLIRVMCAAVLANLLKGDPFWLFLVSASGGAKTEIIRAFNKLDYIYHLSDLTEQTFLSGVKKNTKASLLLRLPQGKTTIITLKDFTTVLSMHQDKKLAILSQLREIYDGYCKKDFGNGESVEWRGKIGLIACVTSVIDTHYTIYQNLGERFLQYRPEQADPLELSKRAMENSGIEKEMREELESAVKIFFEEVEIYKDFPTIEENIKEKLMYIASFCATARSSVMRDSGNREIILVPDPELPTRLSKQLLQMLVALNIISDGYTIENLKIIQKIGLDSIPKNRLKLLLALKSKEKSSVKELSLKIHLPDNTTRKILEELDCLNLVSKEGESNKFIYFISAYAGNLLNQFVFEEKEVC